MSFSHGRTQALLEVVRNLPLLTSLALLFRFGFILRLALSICFTESDGGFLLVAPWKSPRVRSGGF